ncbi:MAG TPA: preprotein translocase subunit YajC [Blastocatellia bacterium]|nr:preprotein translocase subunit YajC [Blastocatellia bacterium]
MDMTTALGFLLFLQEGQPQQQPGAGSFITTLLPFILIFGIFYLLVIRPQQKKQRQLQQEREELLNALKTGDKVVTTGGIYGTIVAVRDNTVTLRIADKVSVEVLRSAIAGPQSAELKEAETAKQ